jgi:hypothetical protein
VVLLGASTCGLLSSPYFARVGPPRSMRALLRYLHAD